MEISHPIWTHIKDISPKKAAVVMPIRNPQEVVASTWEYWKSVEFWKHCIFKILDMALSLEYTVVIVSHRHMLTEPKKEVAELVKALTSLGVLGLDALRVTCINPKLWRCREESSAEISATYPSGVSKLWRYIMDAHSRGERIFNPEKIRSLMRECDDRETDGYQDIMAKANADVIVEHNHKLVRRTRLLLHGFGPKIVDIIASYLGSSTDGEAALA